MRSPDITIQDYEAAEREILTRSLRRHWLTHAGVFGAAAAGVAIAAVSGAGVSWTVYFVLALWAIGLALHYRVSVRYGDAHVREQQVRIEWNAGRSKEHLLPRA